MSVKISSVDSVMSSLCWCLEIWMSVFFMVECFVYDVCIWLDVVVWC